MSGTITANGDGGVMMKVKVIGQMDNTKDNTFESANRVYDTACLSPTLNACGGGNLQPKVIDKPVCWNSKEDGVQPKIQNRVYSSDATSTAITTGFHPAYTVKVRQATKQGFTEMEIGGVADLSYPESETRRGRVLNRGQVAPTLMTDSDTVMRIEDIDEEKQDVATSVRGGDGTLYRIRKLTPLECYRLMGVSDEDAEKMLEVNSESQCYKQAGNSIVVQVLERVFEKLNIDKEG